MKLCIFEVRPDEREYLNELQNARGVELVLSPEVPTLENCGLVEGCQGVSFLGQGKIDRALLQAWQGMGVRAISTRTIGHDHIDLAAAKEFDITVCNAAYPPTGVADYTIMLILLCLRHYKQALWRGNVNDFSLQGLQGKELHSMTVGVVGCGAIGATVLKELTGFGCRLLAYNRSRSQEVERIATYVDLDTLYRESDIISLHLPLTAATYHMIDDAAIAKMKDGVILINCARGGLMDLDALIQGVESCKIGALGLDVVEGEEGITHVDHRTDILANKNMAYLKQFRNVVMTQHMAFYTDVAVKSMVDTAVGGICDLILTGGCQTQL